MTYATRTIRNFALHWPGAVNVRAIAFVAFTLLATHPAQAQQGAPVLRESITVYSDVVTLGDLFENAATVANIPVFRSPDMGQDGIVTSHRIAAAAHQHGLIWTNPGEIDKVAVSRPSRLVTLDDFRQLIAGRIATDLGIEDESSIDVTLDPKTNPIHLDSHRKTPLIVHSLDQNNSSGSFRAVIGFSILTESQPNIVVRGRAIEMVQVAVPSENIDRKQIITADNIKVLRIAKSRIRRNTLLNRDELIGQAAKRRLAVNRPVLRTDLEAPKLIKRNTMVEILFKSGGLLLKAEGRALADAAMGEAVKVLNIQTKRTIEGTAIAVGVVSVAGRKTPALRLQRTSQTQPKRVSATRSTQNRRVRQWQTSVVRSN